MQRKSRLATLMKRRYNAKAIAGMSIFAALGRKHPYGIHRWATSGVRAARRRHPAFLRNLLSPEQRCVIVAET